MNSIALYKLTTNYSYTTSQTEEES